MPNPDAQPQSACGLSKSPHTLMCAAPEHTHFSWSLRQWMQAAEALLVTLKNCWCRTWRQRSWMPSYWSLQRLWLPLHGLSQPEPSLQLYSPWKRYCPDASSACMQVTCHPLACNCSHQAVQRAGHACSHGSQGCVELSMCQTRAVALMLSCFMLNSITDRPDNVVAMSRHLQHPRGQRQRRQRSASWRSWKERWRCDCVNQLFTCTSWAGSVRVGSFPVWSQGAPARRHAGLYTSL